MKRSAWSLSVVAGVALLACGSERLKPVPDAGVPLPTETCLDNDGDGVPGTGVCTGAALVDCNDQNPNAYPGAPELCNGLDDNCNGQVDEGLTVIAYYEDGDGDGYGSTPAGAGCKAPPRGAVTQAGDCDDRDATVHPGAAERCNGVDDDCDQAIDNGLPFQNFSVDSDGDGYGDPSSAPMKSCQAQVAGRVPNASDCDDHAPSVHPGAVETCNKVDDDCDGQVDNGIAYQRYYPDVDGDGFGSAGAAPLSSCAPVPGKVTDQSDCNDGSPSIHPGAPESCNGQDDNCDTRIDEGLTFANYYPDLDGDGFGAAGSAATSSCQLIAGKVTNAGDCDDLNPQIKPGAPETCNGVDDNCDSLIDNGLNVLQYFTDADGDGYGAVSAAPTSACAPVAGKVTNATDCNDANPAIKPGAPETCNGVDDNCNGQIDEGLTPKSFYPDSDGDGFGAATASATVSCQAQLAGKVTDHTDCNDGAPSIHPGAAEICNGLDDNCNGAIDENTAPQSFYPDADGDGYGAAGGSPVSSCAPIAGKVNNNTDCDDTRSGVHPGAVEVCNALDDNCVGGIDEGLPTTAFYPDADGDGYGASTAAATASCMSSLAGKVTSHTDCDDTRSLVHPGATELCNSLDDNCNGQTDEGNPGGGAVCSTGQQGVCAAGTMTCSVGAVSCARNVAPTAELCDGLDNDCNGAIDEPFTTKGQACTAGLGVCLRSGTTVCNAAKTGTKCSASPGAPTAAACDGQDNDCDGVVDEPALTDTRDVSTTAWQDVEVQPYYYTAGSCNGGTSGAGTDALAGGAMVMATGTSGVLFQKLDTTGKPVGGTTSVTPLTYSDVALAQAGDGYLVAGVWSSNNAEIDLYYADAATGAQRAHLYTQFRVALAAPAVGDHTLDSLRVVRGNGRRAVVLWREEGTGIKLAAVEACNTAGSWSIQPLGCTGGAITPSLVVANPAVPRGLGADSAFPDWVTTQPCNNPAFIRLLAVAYSPGASAVNFFTVYEDGSIKSSPEDVVYSSSAPVTVAEPELSYFQDGAGTSQWVVAWVRRNASTPDADLNFWLTNDKTFHWLYLANGTQNGINSVTRPRISATASGLWFSALRSLTAAEEPSGFSRQVMTRTTDLLGTRVPAGQAVELSATQGVCGVDPSCRAGNKDAFTNWAAFGRVYYSETGSTPVGTSTSTLTCN